MFIDFFSFNTEFCKHIQLYFILICMPSLEAGCFSFVVVELRKPEISTSSDTVRSLLKPWDHPVLTDYYLLISSDSEFSYSFFFLEDLCLPCSAI